MPEPQTIDRAVLREIRFPRRGDPEELSYEVSVQFNPESLKVAFSNQSAGGGQPGGSGVQYVGKGTTKLSFELWFDATVDQPDGETVSDVRELTEKVAYFMQVQPSSQEDKFIPPGVRFLWGTFLFDGVMDSIDENLEYFSEDGRPLRASVAIKMSRQEIQFQRLEAGEQGLSAAASPGTQPQQQAQAGDSAQSLAAAAGAPEEWQEDALAAGIEDPLRLTVGATFSIGIGGSK